MVITITEIRKLKSGRYGLYADFRFLLSLDEETLVRSGIKKGDCLDSKELDGLLGESVRRKARDKALTLLSYRDHSKAELTKKIARTAGEEAAGEAAEEMERLGLVQDETFAKTYAKELFYHKLYGKERVVYEMLRKGLDRELVMSTIENMTVDSSELILRFIQKKYPRGIHDETAKRRAVAALQRNGYVWEEIREAIRTMENAETDFEDRE